MCRAAPRTRGRASLRWPGPRTGGSCRTSARHALRADGTSGCLGVEPTQQLAALSINPAAEGPMAAPRYPPACRARLCVRTDAARAWSDRAAITAPPKKPRTAASEEVIA
jgi:hypothetical protein